MEFLEPSRKCNAFSNSKNLVNFHFFKTHYRHAQKDFFSSSKSGQRTVTSIYHSENVKESECNNIILSLSKVEVQFQPFGLCSCLYTITIVQLKMCLYSHNFFLDYNFYVCRFWLSKCSKRELESLRIAWIKKSLLKSYIFCSRTRANFVVVLVP